MMANDIEKITMVDKANMLDGLTRFPEQIKEALTTFSKSIMSLW